MAKRIQVVQGSDNIFRDLGLPNPEELLAKAEIASRISQAIRARRLTQARAARILGIDQPKVSRLLRGHLQDFSTERLLRFARLIGQDIEVVMRTPRRPRKGRLRVIAA
jgi:predicted XRE-type DNA-binding protein